MTLGESPQTSQRGFVWAGSYTDMYFGEVTGTSYITLQISDSIKDFDPSRNPRIDSMYLQLPILDYYGENLDNVQLDVFPLNNPLDQDSAYTNNSTFPLSDLVIGSETYDLAAPGFSGRDTTVRLDISRSYQLSFFENAPANAFLSVDNFIDYFPGLGITSSNLGGMVRIQNSSTGARLRIFYRYGDSLNVSKEMSFFLAEIINTPNPINHFFSVNADRSGTTIENINEQFASYPPTADSLLFLQGLTGILPVFDITNALTDLEPSASRILLNQAVLELGEPFNPDTLRSPDNYIFPLTNSSNRFFYFADTTNFIQSLQSAGQVPFAIGNELVYNPRAGNRLDITDYIQSYFDGVVDKENFILYPQTFTSSPYRAIFRSDSIYLRVAYTKY